MSIIQGNAHTSAGGYQIERSLRFNSADSAYLNRTFASDGNRKTWTWSAWIKPSRFASQQPLWTSFSSSTNYGLMSFSASSFYDSEDTFKFMTTVSNAVQCRMITTAVYRDPSAWYHFVVAIDTTQATASNRIKIYVNGVQVTAFNTATYPSQNTDISFFNTTNAQQIGTLATGTYGYFSGYMTEINFIDGQALTPSSFGETDSATGVWKPKAFSGTYGTNGFYLKFADNSGTTSTTLGKDSSGNGNNWTPNNFSVTAGAGNDSLVDSPTSYGTDTGAGGTVRGNYCTMNPINATSAAGTSLSNGNLQINGYGTGGTNAWIGTLGVSSGKWYYEVTMGEGNGLVGISKTGNPNTYPGGDSTSYSYTSGIKYNNGASTAYGAALTGGDVVGVAYDLDAGTITFYKNGVSQGQAFSGLSGNYFPAVRSGTTGATVSVNFGQRAFAYTAPSGFKALCTQNLPTPTIGATSTTQANDYMNVVTYTGNGSTQSITGVGFQPDWTWIKIRNAAGSHALADAVRGSTIQLASNNTDAEITRADTITSFASDGFNLGANTTGYSVNINAQTYVAWNWKANGAGSSNTAGTITSTVSANTTSGFSIVTYTGTGSNATVGHGLGVAPSMIIIKARGSVASGNWTIYNKDIGATKYLYLNSTIAASTFNHFQNTDPTSSLFYVVNDGNVNQSSIGYVAYCFAPVAGYSAFGSYTGNGSGDGVFVYTGFRPRYLLIKETGNVNSWEVYDTARNEYNVQTQRLFPNDSQAEATTNPSLDILSNGFKCRAGNTGINRSGGTYIYMAIAESPFKYSLGR